MDWNALLMDIMYAVIIAVVPVLTTYAVKFLKAQFNKVHIYTEQSVIRNTLADIEDIILTAVDTTSQTFVESLKEAGKFDEAAQKEAFQKSKDTILRLLNNESKELLVTLYNDLDTWLDSKIEATVKASKKIPDTK